jgi:hypothetical protein
MPTLIPCSEAMNTATQDGHAMPEVVTTDALPPRRRLNAWRDAIVDAHEPADIAAIPLPAGLHKTLAKMAVVAALCASCPAPALALMAQQPIAFNVPSGPLGNALIEIGKQCGTIVSFNPSLVEGVAAAPVQGEFTPMQAFMQALSASGLVDRRDAERRGDSAATPCSEAGSENDDRTASLCGARDATVH